MLHLRSRDAHVNGGHLLDALPGVAAVVDALRQLLLFQRPIRILGPRRPPRFGLARIIPVGGIDSVAFETSAGEPDAPAASVEVVFLPAFRAPFAVLFQRAESKHDMGVRVAVALVVDGKIRAHAGGNKSVPDIGADKPDLRLPVKLVRQSNFNFAGKLGIAAFLGFLHAVPEGGAVGKLRRGMSWKKNSRMHHAAFFRIIVRDAVPIVYEFFAASVSGCGNGAPALTAFDDFDAVMVDRRDSSGPLSMDRWI